MSYSQPIPEDSLYLGQTPPGNTAKIFANNTISRGDLHGRLAISPDGKEVLWNPVNFETWTATTMHVTKKDGKWSNAEIPSFAMNGTTVSPLFSPDGKKLFYNYRVSVDSSYVTKYVEKTDTGWSEPKSDGFLLNTSSSFTSTGKVYFSDTMTGKSWNTGIYCALYSETGLTNIQPLPATINSPDIIEYTPYIASDESYLLFSSNRPMTGENDLNMYLYISFNNNGIWSTPQKINHAIGFSGKARFPSVSPDGKFLFFCGDDRNIYWVDIKTIEQLKPTGVEKEKFAPKKIHLNQNYPNPFNPATTIQYSLSKPSQVKMSIYNLLGQNIRTLQDSFQSAGKYSLVWDAMDEKNNPASSGIFFYKLEAGNLNIQKKMVLVR
jgi:hypothetical protein